MLKEFLRYNLVGIANTIVGFSIIFSLMFIGISPIVSNLIGYIFGVMLSYYLNSRYTFNSSKSKSKAIRFFGVLFISYLLNLIALQWFLTFVNPYIAQLFAMIIYTINSFLLMKLIVFKEDLESETLVPKSARLKLSVPSFSKYPFMILSIIIGIFYYWLVKVDISNIENNRFIIDSKIEQEGKFHIKVVDKFTTLNCNKKEILFDNNKTHTYFYRGGEEIVIDLKRGKNLCEMRKLTPKVGYKIGYLDYVILFVLVGVPLYQTLFNLLINIIERRDEP